LQNTFLDDWSLVSEQVVVNEDFYPPHNCKVDKQVQILTSGPDQHWDTVQELYFGAISAAKERIWITSPYFIPDEALRTALKTAAVSGVEVKVLIPDQGDSRIVQLASLSYVEELMLAGVEFYQYTKGFVHAKIIIIDDLLGSVGTANMDMRSFFYNFEMIALLFDENSVSELITDFKQDLEHSKRIDLREFQLRPKLQKGAELLARLVSPLL
jgi:cardiolipin synthase